MDSGPGHPTGGLTCPGASGVEWQPGVTCRPRLDVRAARLQVAEQVLQVALQPRPVVALEDPQLVDLALEQPTLLLQLGERPAGRLLGLADDPTRLHL